MSAETKIDLISLIIDRFSIRNHRYNAQNLKLHSMVSDLTLLSRPAPLLGRLRYTLLPYSIREGVIIHFNYYTLQFLQGNHGPKVNVILLQKQNYVRKCLQTLLWRIQFWHLLAVLCKHLLNDTYQP